MTQHIHKPACMDAGTRTELLSRAAGSLHYVNPNVKPITVESCLTSKPAFTGNAVAIKRTAPGCCSLTDTQSISIPCCPMIYEPAHSVTECKVEPYVGTRIQQNAATDMHNCIHKACEM